jgi:hypothetical protein
VTTRVATGPGPNRTRTPVHLIARDRAYQARRLRLGGADWGGVAARTGYAEGRVAALAVTAFLQKTAVEQGPDHRREVLRQELDRLDALQFGYWPAAVNGDHNAANIVLKCIARRCTVLGFDRADDPIATPVPSLVIGGTTEEYVNGFKAIVEGRDRHP